MPVFLSKTSLKYLKKLDKSAGSKIVAAIEGFSVRFIPVDNEIVREAVVSATTLRYRGAKQLEAQ